MAATVAQIINQQDWAASGSGRRILVNDQWTDSQPASGLSSGQKANIDASLAGATAPSTVQDASGIIVAAAAAAPSTVQQCWAYLAGGG